MSFRYDINGLRAIAVLAVVLFHFNPTWLPGGFAGVDVFFVISGFLMTSIIFKGVEKNTFNLFKFYNARANRIIPVLAALSIVLVMFGIFYLLPTDLEQLGKQIQKSTTFTSNLLFAKGGGYFDTGEKTKWLLHTWSLSVEWQFYIFFPIIILLLKRFLNIENIKKVVLVLCILSFCYCVYATLKDSKTAYFLLTSRAWEMLIGGLAFLYPITIQSVKKKALLQLTGISLIMVSYIIISEHTPWPGYMALLPVFGTYLIILCNFQNNPIINNPFFNHIGKWSYSIYVWHWPIVVAGVYFSIQHWWLCGIPLSILLGYLSYQFIEKIKFQSFSSWKDIYKVKPLYMFLFILALGLFIKKTNGMEFLYSNSIKEILNAVDDSNPYECDSRLKNNTLYECVIGNPENIKAIIVGDSHADAITTAVAASFNLKKEGIIAIVTAGCPFVIDAKINYHDKVFCHDLNIQRMQWLVENKNKYINTPLIVSGRWVAYLKNENDPEKIENNNLPPLYFGSIKFRSQKDLFALFSDKLEKTLCPLTSSYQVYALLPIPEMGKNVPKTLAKNILMNQSDDSSITLSDYQQRSSGVHNIFQEITRSCNVKILDPAAILCKTGRCIAEFKGRPIYRDGDHLSEYGNKLLTPMFKQALL
ncbi:acyltransferase family protein [Acinetobacter pullicarnis]|uniref:acyltransferase family protein n=1 Tax=Acinetobacter pullicarnis TaxID=2576829 RepID=UPI001121918E|nr:acyltransferase family protein [Acinetobacter pullicarnis]